MSLNDCFTFCQGFQGVLFVEYFQAVNSCNCVQVVIGSRTVQYQSQLFAIGEPRTPIEGDCSGRRLAEQQYA